MEGGASLPARTHINSDEVLFGILLTIPDRPVNSISMSVTMADYSLTLFVLTGEQHTTPKTGRFLCNNGGASGKE